MPEIIYRATFNTEISLASVFFDGKGKNLFANMKDYDMFVFKFNIFLKLSFHCMYELIARYSLYGEDPFIIGADDKVPFSAGDYESVKVKEICQTE